MSLCPNVELPHSSSLRNSKRFGKKGICISNDPMQMGLFRATSVAPA